MDKMDTVDKVDGMDTPKRWPLHLVHWVHSGRLRAMCGYDLFLICV
jgi:hypothetical protein